MCLCDIMRYGCTSCLSQDTKSESYANLLHFTKVLFNLNFSYCIFNTCCLSNMLGKLGGPIQSLKGRWETANQLTTAAVCGPRLSDITRKDRYNSPSSHSKCQLLFQLNLIQDLLPHLNPIRLSRVATVFLVQTPFSRNFLCFWADCQSSWQ